MHLVLAQIVQFVSIHTNRVLFYSQRMVSERFFDGTFTFTMPDVPSSAINERKGWYREKTANAMEALLLEYEAMT
jgi:hypothetical protein